MIRITAILVVRKQDLRDQGIDTSTDEGIAVPVATYLQDRLPHGWTGEISVGIQRKVKNDHSAQVDESMADWARNKID